jgi:O-methyltransferase involved in polyketide biosynthesis
VVTVQEKKTDSIMQGIYGAQISRTRFIDDTVHAALLQRIRQFIILGVGFDTRPYRLTGLERVEVFGIDLTMFVCEGERIVQAIVVRP